MRRLTLCLCLAISVGCGDNGMSNRHEMSNRDEMSNRHDLKGIIGSWKTEMVTKEGESPDLLVNNSTADLVFTRSGYLMSETERGTYSTGGNDEIDFKAESGPQKGRVLKALIRVDGDILRLCVTIPPITERPKSFESTANSKTMIVTYRRVRDL